ncbi:hypothetical protein EGT47_11785 [Burkholderia cenocepacia]|uniref:hypothetical protein n=1 Tax=Burkholderia cenocepacia TaxID=95486 RepID=UPI000F673E37|nr:hypothetical protein [Burkholderia cenocepacia]RSB89398.1 hypothetical protein EGT47_11785 [Burkholderia cenocepacia]
MVVDTGRQPLLIRSPGARRRLLFAGAPDSLAEPLPAEPEIGDIVFIRVTELTPRSWTVKI